MGPHQRDHRAVSTGTCNGGFGASVAELLIAIQHQPGRLLELVGIWQRRAVSDQAGRADQRDLVAGGSGDRAAQLGWRAPALRVANGRSPRDRKVDLLVPYAP